MQKQAPTWSEFNQNGTQKSQFDENETRCDLKLIKIGLNYLDQNTTGSRFEIHWDPTGSNVHE